MSDRLNELRRQRALVQEHLAWLDREIAETDKPAGGTLASPATPRPTTAAAESNPWSLVQPRQPAPVTGPSGLLVTPRAASSTTTDPAATDALFDQYRIEPSNVKNDVRKGCLLYFALAFVLLGLGVMALWLAFRR